MDWEHIVSQLNFEYEEYQCWIREHDATELAKHNAKRSEISPYFFQEKLSPCPFEGDLLDAKVILLLANPGYDSQVSTPDDHKPIHGGWGLWGLSQDAPEGMHGWWRPRLRAFIDDDSETSWMELSNKLASVQAVPWASTSFHDANRLPSKKLLAHTVRRLAYMDPAKIFVVVRQRRYWDSVLSESNARVIYTKSPMCSYITEGNIAGDAAWLQLYNVLKKSEKLDINVWRKMELGKWLNQTVIRPGPATTIQISEIDFDWKKLEGSFALDLDGVRLPVRLGMHLAATGYLSYSRPYVNPPHEWHMPASYPAVEFDTGTSKAIELQVRQLLPKICGLGLHPVTKMFVDTSTPLEERILDKDEFLKAKAALTRYGY